ncbi:MAG: amidohydrolase family protein [Beijerinckiaceae bacterium]
MQIRTWIGAAVVAIALTAASHDFRGARAQEIPIFDAHMHYNQEPTPYYSLERIQELFREHGVIGVLATSRPNIGTHQLVAGAKPPLVVVPFLRPYRVRDDIGSWFDDPATLALIEEEWGKQRWRGIGEFHVSGAGAERPTAKRIVTLARERGLFLHAHSDDVAIESFFRHEPASRIIWAHTGFSLPAARVGEMLEKYPNLTGELSYRSGIVNAQGDLTSEWRKLFQRHPDRFVLGSDTWINERWASYGRTMAQYRAWLRQLPPPIAERIAWRNADALFAVNLGEAAAAGTRKGD